MHTPDYSIEGAVERVYDRTTRENLREVVGCYNNGYYRACIVVLWSAIVCDYLLKLEELGSNGSKRVLGGVPVKHTQDLAWERKLIDAVEEHTSLLSEFEKTRLLQLMALRHACAHPTRESDGSLMTPTREDARAQLRFALDTVFTRPPHYETNYLVPLLEDLEQRRDYLVGDVLHRFLAARYGAHLTPQGKERLVADLWKMCFAIDNIKANENRKVNVAALSYFVDSDPKLALNAISARASQFRRVADGPLNGQVEAARFLARRPGLWGALPDDVRAHFEAAGQASPDIHLLVWHSSDTLAVHLARISGREAPSQTTMSVVREICADTSDHIALQDYTMRLYLDCAKGEGARRWSTHVSPACRQWDASAWGRFVTALRAADDGPALAAVAIQMAHIERETGTKIEAPDGVVWPKYHFKTASETRR